jgi:hypothetical protein
MVVVVGVVVAIVALTGSDDDSPPPGTAGPTDPPVGEGGSEVCDPPTWDGEITAEGNGTTRIPLDALPEHPFFYLTFTYAPAGGQDFFQVNTVVGGDEGGFLNHFETGELTGSTLLRREYGPGPVTELVVNTEGTWTLQIRDLHTMPTWPDITEGGVGGAQMWVEPGTLSGPTQALAEHEGYFSVNVYTDTPVPEGMNPISEQLVLSPDGGASEFVLPPNTCLVLISADAPWTVTLP